jgi:hypothetical protein
MRQSQSNIPLHPRWSVERASQEFNLTEPTLRKLLSQNSIRASEDGCFSTKEICNAVFGDLASEKLLTQRQLTRKHTNENLIVEGAYVNKLELQKLFSAVADSMCARIEASGLSPEEKVDLRRELASVRPGIDGIAKRQSKLPAKRNGERDIEQGEDDSE